MSRLKSALLLLVGLAIVLLMVHYIGVNNVIEVLTQVDPLIFAAALCCQAAALLLWSLRWKILLRP